VIASYLTACSEIGIKEQQTGRPIEFSLNQSEKQALKRFVARTQWRLMANNATRQYNSELRTIAKVIKSYLNVYETEGFEEAAQQLQSLSPGSFSAREVRNLSCLIDDSNSKLDYITQKSALTAINVLQGVRAPTSESFRWPTDYEIAKAKEQALADGVENPIVEEFYAAATDSAARLVDVYQHCGIRYECSDKYIQVYPE
jgi:hypothetical protein